MVGKNKDSNECEVNYESTSRQMEKTASLILFQRSEERLKLRYTSLLGDGDTKTIKDINKEMPYGPGFIVSKEECVGHVAKHFHKHLTTAQAKYVPDENGKLVSMKGGKDNAEQTSRKLTRYYKGAIMNNTGDVDGMTDDIKAIYYHSISTDEEPRHKYCPEREHTCCSYNKHMHETAKYPDKNMPEHKHDILH